MTTPKPTPPLTEARRHAADARKRVESLLGLPAQAQPTDTATPEQSLLHAIGVVRNLPMHKDVRYVLDIVESYLRKVPQ